MRYTLICLVTILSLQSCEINKPETPIVNEGKVFVTSNVDKAEIFLNEVTTGKFTPDTITAFATGYTIKLRKTKYFSGEERVIFKRGEVLTLNIELRENNLKRNIIFETFSNIGCEECVIIDSTIEQITNNFISSEIVKVTYPSKYPNVDDIFYLVDPIEFDNRFNYYDQLQSNSIYLNGNNISWPKNYKQIEHLVNENLLSVTNFTILVFDSLDSGPGYVASIFIDVFDTDQIDFNRLTLIVLVVENNIVFDEPSESNEKKIFNNIVRSFFPDFRGRSLSNIGKKGRHKFFETKTLNPLWKLENLEIIAFIQDNISKEILQVGSTFN